MTRRRDPRADRASKRHRAAKKQPAATEVIAPVKIVDDPTARLLVDVDTRRLRDVGKASDVVR